MSAPAVYTDGDYTIPQQDGDAQVSYPLQQEGVLGIYDRRLPVEGCPLFSVYTDGCTDLDARLRLPDGSDRFVVDEPLLMAWTARLGGQLADPIKTTNVQQLRCMTTWVVER